MADYYKNSDMFCNDTRHRTAKGVRYDVVQVTGAEPISLEDVKKHLRVDYNVDDNLLQMYITAAREYLEGYCQKSFVAKTMRLRAIQLPDNYKLMYGPVSEQEGVFGDTLLSGGDKVDLEFTTEGMVNDNIRNAIAMEAANRYMIREGIPINDNGNSPGQLENLAKELVRPYRNVTI